MSEPVQKPEIDDVLSSIRRLVSGENRQKGPEPEARAAPSTERFVLTPALRVADAPGARVSRNAPEPLVPDAAQVSFEPAPESVAEPVAEEPEPVAVPLAVAEPASVEPVPEAPAPVSGDAEEAEADVAAEEPEAPMAEDVTVPLVQPVGEGSNVSPLRRCQDAVAPAELEAELEQATETDRDLSRLKVALEQEGDDAPEVRSEPDGASLLPSDELKAKIASLAGAVERTRGAWPAPPEAVAPEAVANEAPEPETGDTDHAAPVSGAGLDQDDEFEGAGEDDEDDAAFIDEETLREMVVEIVRDELRGALGMRITRNVRKLVRQEIQRLLATQSIDRPE